MLRWTNDVGRKESRMRGQQTYPVYKYILTCEQYSKLGRQHTKAPLAAALCPFMSLLYPPNPWCERCDVWRLATPPRSTSPTLFEHWCGFFHVPQDSDKRKCCETGCTVFRPNPGRLQSVTVCRCYCKGCTFFSFILMPRVLVWPVFEPVTSQRALSSEEALMGLHGESVSECGRKICLTWRAWYHM